MLCSTSRVLGAPRCSGARGLVPSTASEVHVWCCNTYRILYQYLDVLHVLYLSNQVVNRGTGEFCPNRYFWLPVSYVIGWFIDCELEIQSIFRKVKDTIGLTQIFKSRPLLSLNQSIIKPTAISISSSLDIEPAEAAVLFISLRPLQLLRLRNPPLASMPDSSTRACNGSNVYVWS